MYNIFFDQFIFSEYVLFMIVPRCCWEYGSDVEGYFTVNPFKSADRMAKFKAYCFDGTLTNF